MLTQDTYDALGPKVVKISAPDGYYKAGDVVRIMVTFDELVKVTGNPILKLATGAFARSAVYNSGNDSTTLVFNYTVGDGDVASDLNALSTSGLLLAGGSITDKYGNHAVLSLPALNSKDDWKLQMLLLIRWYHCYY